jgi:hypothetical protein
VLLSSLATVASFFSDAARASSPAPLRELLLSAASL